MSTISTRQYLLDPGDAVYQLPLATFARMHKNPAKFSVAEFAGVRARADEVSVELVDRRPRRILRAVFHILNFDKHGILDVASYDARQSASVVTALETVFSCLREPASVIDAAHRFVASGGRWEPTEAESALVARAALGQLKCRKLRFAVAP